MEFQESLIKDGQAGEQLHQAVSKCLPPHRRHYRIIARVYINVQATTVRLASAAIVGFGTRALQILINKFKSTREGFEIIDVGDNNRLKREVNSK